ncbi:hypothetical protein CVCC1112_1003 [Paenarthrobacter nicotinovorans]|nr:hypothetical protein CVCC1112_1003 [Paenarthrobacter nicotinovorans]
MANRWINPVLLACLCCDGPGFGAGCLKVGNLDDSDQWVRESSWQDPAAEGYHGYRLHSRRSSARDGCHSLPRVQDH